MASLNEEIESFSFLFLQENVVLHKAVKLIFIDIEDSSLTSLDSTHLTHLFSNSRLPVFTENVVTLSSVKSLPLVVGHLDCELVLLTSDQTTGSKSSFVVARNVSKSHTESFVRVRLLNQLSSSISKERKNSVVNLFQVFKDIS